MLWVGLHSTLRFSLVLCVCASSAASQVLVPVLATGIARVCVSVCHVCAQEGGGVAASAAATKCANRAANASVIRVIPFHQCISSCGCCSWDCMCVEVNHLLLWQQPLRLPHFAGVFGGQQQQRADRVVCGVYPLTLSNLLFWVFFNGVAHAGTWSAVAAVPCVVC